MQVSYQKFVRIGALPDLSGIANALSMTVNR